MSTTVEGRSLAAGWSSLSNSHLAFFVLSVGVTALTYQLHELSHFVAGLLAGLDERYLVSGVQTLTAQPASWQLLVQTAAGPMVTLAVAVTCLALFIRSRGANNSLLAATLCTAFLRIQPMATDIFSRFAKTQDEFKIAEALGMPGRPLMAVSLAVFLLVYVVALVCCRRCRLGTVIAQVVGSACAAVGINTLGPRLLL